MTRNDRDRDWSQYRSRYPNPSRSPNQSWSRSRSRSRSQDVSGFVPHYTQLFGVIQFAAGRGLPPSAGSWKRKRKDKYSCMSLSNSISFAHMIFLHISNSLKPVVRLSVCPSVRPAKSPGRLHTYCLTEALLGLKGPSPPQELERSPP